MKRYLDLLASVCTVCTGANSRLPSVSCVTHGRAVVVDTSAVLHLKRGGGGEKNHKPPSREPARQINRKQIERRWQRLRSRVSGEKIANSTPTTAIEPQPGVVTRGMKHQTRG